MGPAIRRVFALIDSRSSIDIHKVSNLCLFRTARPSSINTCKESTLQAGAEPLIDGDVELKSVTFAYPTPPGRLLFKEFNIKVQAGTSCALVRCSDKTFTLTGCFY